MKSVKIAQAIEMKGEAMCKIEGCDARAVAMGLCAKHYMRQRRTGDPTKIRMPGAPRKGGLDARLRDLFPEWSRRTQDRYIRAFKTLSELGGRAAIEAAVLKASRPNGTMNVALFERCADAAVMKAVRSL